MYYPNGISSYDVEVRLEFCLVDSNGRPSQVHKVSLFCEFGYESCNQGFSGFIAHDKLDESGYLRDDSFVVQCTIGILDSSIGETSESPDSDTVPADGLPPSDLHGQIGKLLEGGEGADVTFNVGGQIFSTHRCILAARSPVFHTQFFGLSSKKSFDNVEVQDMEATVFKFLLQYLYTDSLPEFINMQSSASAILAWHLLAAADRYSIERLKTICKQWLSKTISTDTTLSLAEQHDCGRLKEACIEFISRWGGI